MHNGIPIVQAAAYLVACACEETPASSGSEFAVVCIVDATSRSVSSQPYLKDCMARSLVVWGLDTSNWNQDLDVFTEHGEEGLSVRRQLTKRCCTARLCHRGFEREEHVNLHVNLSAGYLGATAPQEEGANTAWCAVRFSSLAAAEACAAVLKRAPLICHLSVLISVRRQLELVVTPPSSAATHSLHLKQVLLLAKSASRIFGYVWSRTGQLLAGARQQLLCT